MAVVAVFSIYICREHLPLACDALQGINPSSVSKDTNVHSFAGELAVAQAYFHLEPSSYSAAINALREKFARLKIEMQSSNAAATLLAFSEYWFSDPNSISRNDFKELSPSRSIAYGVEKRYSTGDIGKIVFLQRPTYELKYSHPVTLIEVPLNVQLNEALDLAHHKTKALDRLFCSIDLLACKVCWLGQNVLTQFDMPPDKFIAHLLDESQHVADKGNTNKKSHLLRTVSQIARLLSAFEMTDTMLLPVEKQLSHFTTELVEETASLRDPLGCCPLHPFPVKYALDDIDSLKRTLQKLTGLLRGAHDIQQKETEIAILQIEERFEITEKRSARRFNFLTLILAMSSGALALAAIVDNDLSKAILDRFSKDWRANLSESETNIYILEFKLGLAATTVVAATIIAILSNLWYGGLNSAQVTSKPKKESVEP